MCAGCSPHPDAEQLSATPAGSPALQLSSDAVYLEIASEPTGEGLSPTRLPPPTSEASLNLRLSPVLLIYDYRWSTPTAPSSGSIHLLKRLTETLGLRDHQFIINGYNSGTARWMSCVGTAWGRGAEPPRSPRARHPPRIARVRRPASSKPYT